MTKASFGVRAPLGVLLILSIAAFLTRLYPLSISPYPFNNDSLTECGIASEILRSGHLEFNPGTSWYGTHSVYTPVHNVAIAFFAATLGVSPLQCAQAFGAVLAVVSIGGLFLLGKLFSGDLRGGVTAAFAGIMMGTFVFTTGSVWKETLGIALLILAILSYVRRNTLEFRVLTFVLLVLLTFVHHLVAAVGLLAFAYLLAWSWYSSLSNHERRSRVIADSITIVIPALVTVWYYTSVSFDSIQVISSPIRIALVIAGFIFVSLVTIIILSMRSHVKWTFAPLVGIGFLVLIVLDYIGFVFPYSPSASSLYILLGVASAYLVALCWYGTEFMLERLPRYRAVQFALLISPMTIIGYGFAQGFSLESHKILYRSFDFLDLFVFLGLAVGVSVLANRRKRLYLLLSSLMIVALVISFPFGYESEKLLGVRHDTQSYEIDAMEWLVEMSSSPTIISDERMAYIAHVTTSAHSDSVLPRYFSEGAGFPPFTWYYVMEDSWTTVGVNDYPNGKLVLSVERYTQASEAADVFYVGGPSGDRIVMFLVSYVGSNTVFVPPSLSS